MTDQSLPISRRLPKLDRVWVAIATILLLAGVFVPTDWWEIVRIALSALGGTLPFIAFAVVMVALLKATGAEGVVAQAFKGSAMRMIVLAALVGGLAPFCSCEVIPFIAALLAMGVPVAAVMAFWLSSPIMDPPMFIITSHALGADFAVAKTVGAVGFGLLGGFSVHVLTRATGLFSDVLRNDAGQGGCGCGPNPFSGKPVWAFWTELDRRITFRTTLLENTHFLLKWLALAYVLEALMILYVPAQWVAGALGGDGIGTIFLGALIGAPAYLNGYAAAELVGGLVGQGMSQGVAMSFMMAGSVTSIPAAMAVWAVVKPRVFGAYICLGFIGSLIAGFVWAAIV